jgi:hypothetical protein
MLHYIASLYKATCGSGVGAVDGSRAACSLKILV